MKRALLIAGILVLMLSVSIASPSCGSSAKGPDTLKVNTTELGAAIIGYNGPTPVEVSVCQGVITNIKALPNRETPRYWQMVVQSGLLGKLVGKTPEEARQEPLDAVSGATFSSVALIQNLRLALENIEIPAE